MRAPPDQPHAPPSSQPLPPRGLLVRQPWAQALVSGTKRWELRNRPTNVRGPVAIIQTGEPHILGTVEVVDCIGPLQPQDLAQAVSRGDILPQEAHDADLQPQYAWVMDKPRSFAIPQPIHPPQAWHRDVGAPGARAGAIPAPNSSTLPVSTIPAGPTNDALRPIRPGPAVHFRPPGRLPRPPHAILPP